MTSTAAPAAPAPTTPPRSRRSVRNYLLDGRFQLKYTGYLVGVTLGVSLVLGALLYLQSEKTVAIGRHATAIGDEAVGVGAQATKAGRDAVAQSDALNKKLEMDALASYGDNPTLIESIRSANQAESEKIVARAQLLEQAERKLVQTRNSLLVQQAALDKQRTMMVWTMSFALTVLVLVLGVAGIVITHKVAGPLYKMKRLLTEVGEGRLVPPGRLRRGDELVDFFDSLSSMIEKLRQRRERELQLLDDAMAEAQRSGNQEGVVAKIQAARERMQIELERT